MSQHNKIVNQYHSYKMSGYFDILTSRKFLLSGLGLKKVIAGADSEFKRTNLKLDENMSISWSDYGDLWITLNSYSGTDVIVSDLPFKHTICSFDGTNSIMFIYSSIYDSHRVVLNGGKVVNTTLRISYYPNNAMFPLKQGALYSRAIKMISALSTQSGVILKSSYPESPTERGFYYKVIANPKVTTSWYKDQASVDFILSVDYDKSSKLIFCPYVIYQGKEFKGNLYQVKDSYQDTDVSTLRVHSNAKTFHFPYPASLLSFERDITITPRDSSMRKWAIENGTYGDGLPNIVFDRKNYRFSIRNNEFQSWYGYATHFPLLELMTSFEDSVFTYGEVDLIFSNRGLEFSSLVEIPIVIYNLTNG